MIRAGGRGEVYLTPKSIGWPWARDLYITVSFSFLVWLGG